MENNVNGSKNTAVGHYSLRGGSPEMNGNYNTALGYESLRLNVNGNNNTAVGYQSLTTNNNGTYNAAVGYGALSSNTDGNDNVAIGGLAMKDNQTGGHNVAIGSNALQFSINGFNVAVGSGALAGASNTGNENIAIGYLAGQKVSSSYGNVLAGAYAGSEITTGSENIALGKLAGSFLNSGNTNVFIGGGSGPNASFGGISNSICVGYNQANNLSNQAVIGNASTSSIGGFQNWSNYSDARMKKNVQENVPGLDFINKLRPVTYNRDVTIANEILNGKKQNRMAESMYEVEQVRYTGLIAQEVETAAKALGYDFSGVKPAKNDQDLYSISYTELVMPLIKAVQELSAANAALQSNLEAQQKEIDALKVKK
jgi:trimeric autotransporter adhesin